MHKFSRRQVSNELNNLKMYNIHCQVTSKQQVSHSFYLFIFQYRDYVVCHLKLQIESAIIATN